MLPQKSYYYNICFLVKILLHTVLDWKGIGPQANTTYTFVWPKVESGC